MGNENLTAILLLSRPDRVGLDRALHHHFEHRVLVKGIKTIIFD